MAKVELNHERAIDQVPRNHSRNQMLICALNLAGPQAAMVIDGALDGATFEW